MCVCVCGERKKCCTLFSQSELYDCYICNESSHIEKNSFDQLQYIFLIHHVMICSYFQIWRRRTRQQRERERHLC